MSQHPEPVIVEGAPELVRRGPSDEAILKGGITTLERRGIEHYRLMGKRSAEVRRVRKELRELLSQIAPDQHIKRKEADEATSNQNQ